MTNLKSFCHSILLRALLLPLWLLLAVGCSEDSQVTPPGDLTLNIIPSLNCEVKMSRANPVAFDNDFTAIDNKKELDFGMWICEDKVSYEPYAIGMANMKSVYNWGLRPAEWQFFYGNEVHDILSVKPSTTPENKIFVYAYWPHDPTNTNPESIFVKSASDELLYASPQEIHPGDAGSSVDVPLVMNHAMACIEFSLTAEHTTDNVILKSLTITDTEQEKGHILPVSSTFDITNGKYNHESDVLTGNIYVADLILSVAKNNIYTTPAKLYIPLIPFEGYTDKRFTFTFDFGYRRCEYQLPAIRQEGETTMSFKQGYKYTYSLMLSNEMTFKTVDISVATENDWTNENPINFEI